MFTKYVVSRLREQVNYREHRQAGNGPPAQNKTPRVRAPVGQAWVQEDCNRTLPDNRRDITGRQGIFV
jgi:hypothetical protein